MCKAAFPGVEKGDISVWLLYCLVRGCCSSKRDQITYASAIGQNVPIHKCANGAD